MQRLYLCFPICCYLPCVPICGYLLFFAFAYLLHFAYLLYLCLPILCPILINLAVSFLYLFCIFPVSFLYLSWRSKSVRIFADIFFFTIKIISLKKKGCWTMQDRTVKRFAWFANSTSRNQAKTCLDQTIKRRFIWVVV